MTLHAHTMMTQRKLAPASNPSRELRENESVVTVINNGESATNQNEAVEWSESPR